MGAIQGVPAYALAWLAGVALQLQQGALWSSELVFAVGVAAASLFAMGRVRKLPARYLATAAACCLLGFASTSWRAQWRLDDALPAQLEGQDLVLTGVVAALPQVNLSGVRFLFEVESATRLDQGPVVQVPVPVQVPGLISLGWYRGFDADTIFTAPTQDIRAGQRWRLTARLRQPHGSLNPHGFDLELWLFEQGIRAGGSVRATATSPPQKLADNAGHPIEQARQSVRDAIERHVSNRTAAGVLAALAIGDQAAIEREDWDIFRATGVAHLMSISGLHVTMFAWLAGAVVGWFWRQSTRLILFAPVPLAARWGGLMLAFLYALLAGWGVPAQRTVWMIGVVVLLRSMGARWPQPVVLLAAGWVVCLLDPWAMLQAGFWLSFFAVALLISSEPVLHERAGTNVSHDPYLAAPPSTWRQRAGAVFKDTLRTQAIATVGLAPLSMVFFQQISIVGFIANLVAIPLVTLFVTPLALAGVFLPWLWWAGAALVQGLMSFLGLLAAMPWAVWSAAAAPAWAGLLGLLGGALLVMPLPWRLRWLGLPLMLPLLMPPVQRPPLGEYEAVAVDIGQGTAVLVRTREHLLLYDTGPMYSAESDAGQRVLVPLLRARGENKIDLLMLSHRDADHVGGAASVMAQIKVSALSTSLEPGHRLLVGSTPHTPCAAGQSWMWDGVRFDVLHPLAQDTGTLIKANALSCTLRVQGVSAHSSLLLTGDIEAAQEAALLQRQLDGALPTLQSKVVLAPHHGSRTSSTGAFLDAVAPHTALVQAAYRSRYGHPAPDVVQRYVDRGITVVRTDRCGAWTGRSDSFNDARCERETQRRYWHHQAAPAQP